MKTKELFSLEHTMARPLLLQKEYPWEILADLKEYILQLGNELPTETFQKIGEDIWIAKDVTIAKTAEIHGPCIIEEGTEIRPGAFIRGSVMIGKGCVIGNSTELKNSILFDQVQVPHFNYIGDSVLGYHAHFGAGAVTSNVKSDKSLVVIHQRDTEIATNRKKVGAMVGDNVEVGCQSVLCPGSVVGKGTTIYPLSMVRGVVPENHIWKADGIVVEKTK